MLRALTDHYSSCVLWFALLTLPDLRHAHNSAVAHLGPRGILEGWKKRGTRRDSRGAAACLVRACVRVHAPEKLAWMGKASHGCNV